MKPLPTLLLALFSFPLCAATWTAADCSREAVEAAIGLASTGDTVEIPAGDCTWTNALGITKAISIIGAGQDVTIIRDGNLEANKTFLGITSTGTNFARLSAITFVAKANSYTTIGAGNILQTNIIRLDHITITNLNTRGIEPAGWGSILIDHCTFYGVNGSPTGVSVMGRGNMELSSFGGNTNENPSWDTIPFAVGSTNMVVVENCAFIWNPACLGANGAADAYNGARFMWRYNYMQNVNVGAHGTDSGQTMRSAHSFECYGNVFSNSIAVIPFSFRGGTGLFYSNAVYQSGGSARNGIRLDNYRSSGTNIYEFLCCSPYGPHSATNIWAGKEDPETGWPSYDQIGRTSPTIYTATNTIQTLQPVYQWSNTFNGQLGLNFYNPTSYTNTGDYAYIPPSSLIIMANRDYYNATEMPDYVPLEYPHPLIGDVEAPPASTGRARVGRVRAGSIRGL